jgi:hypothetical protein
MSNSNAMPFIVAIRRARNVLRRLTRSARRRVPGGQSSPDRSPFVVNARPIHAYIVLESSPAELQRLLSRIAQESGHSRDHTPVIFTDSTDFSAIAESGTVFEYLPDREMWQRHRPDWLWDSFVQERLAELDRCYRPDKTIVVSGPDDARRG